MTIRYEIIASYQSQRRRRRVFCVIILIESSFNDLDPKTRRQRSLEAFWLTKEEDQKPTWNKNCKQNYPINYISCLTIWLSLTKTDCQFIPQKVILPHPNCSVKINVCCADEQIDSINFYVDSFFNHLINISIPWGKYISLGLGTRPIRNRETLAITY